ncbi:DNA ligase [Vibrio sp. V05_P4A8T149]|nr:DNA ligase [Vibrio sp. V24_P1S3T111]OXX20570.1 DNA ligase [Vibrio sp. V06_P1A73T115]OXX26881.1 DNA ligase [Vibrio sp. V05_P4A8T149]OXX28941.1 DNA ligase [Vibrio sp. V14_P6S14T42]OXX37230.1 DNA ligase [Vibrio sp. V04_P4A5T148]OXX54167.1 DNA ligase [Vibrio sp. V18_P1S4T112]
MKDTKRDGINMQENLCPCCQNPLMWDGRYHCAQCKHHFNKIGFCPECDSELEKLQACGAANFFCNSCNELKSKSKIRFEFQAQD